VLFFLVIFLVWNGFLFWFLSIVLLLLNQFLFCFFLRCIVGVHQVGNLVLLIDFCLCIILLFFFLCHVIIFFCLILILEILWLRILRFVFVINIL